MDTPKITGCPLAAVETSIHPCKEPDEPRTGRTPGMAVSDEWTRRMVECRRFAHERCLYQTRLQPDGTALTT